MSDAGALRARFDSKRRLDPTSGCWMWTASMNAKGYGHIQVNGAARKLSEMA